MQGNTSTVGDRVRLPLTFDVAKMQADVARLGLHPFVHYDVHPLTAPAHLVDPTRPLPSPVDDYADGSWTEWLDTKTMQECPYLQEVVATFRQHTDVTLVRLLRLEAGGEIREHNDPTLGLEIERSVIRLTVPIAGNDNVTFFLNQTPVPMGLGECWYLRLTDLHRVLNEGATERVNMTIDMIPNAWVRSMIEGAA